VDDPSGQASVLVLGWGSTYGPIGAAVKRVRRSGGTIAQAHLRHLNPFPANLGSVLAGYHHVVLPEMNLGQLAMLVRAKYLVDVISLTQVSGMPFKAADLAEMLQGVLDSG
jgi:2-oxoglutarate/2-oxoacid ferredoxin oxidoreductase subunit alpha